MYAKDIKTDLLISRGNSMKRIKELQMKLAISRADFDFKTEERIQQQIIAIQKEDELLSVVG